MERQSIIKCKIKINHIHYPKKLPEAGDWASFVASVEECYEGEPMFNRSNRLSVSGIVPDINYYDSYILMGKHKYSEQYGDQYEVLTMSKFVDLTDPVEQRVFLERVLTDSQINTLYENLANPFEIIKSK